MTFQRAAAWAVTPKHPSNMPRFRYIPLQWKFITIASVAIVVFAVIFGGLATSRNKSALYGATEKQGKVLAQTVAALIINELIYEKLGLVEEGGLIDNYLQELFKRRELDYLYLAVLDENGRVISHSDFREYGKVYHDKIVDFTEGVDVIVTRLPNGPDDALEFSAPLSIGGKNWGVFLFAVSLRHVNEEVRHIFLEIWTVAAIALLCGFVLVFFLSRRFIRPITTLAGVMQKIDVQMPEDQLAPVTGNDELAQLAMDFNAMINRLSRANEETQQAHEKLLQSEKLATLGILSSSVAHRINNPLGGLQNCVAMLKRNSDDPEFRTKYLDLMQEGLESIEQTVSQLLWTAGKRRGEESRANIKDVVAAVMRLTDYRFKKSGIRYNADLSKNICIAASPHDLNQILVNLLINAAQAMPKGGELNVTAKSDDGNVIISISDTGLGISPAAIPHIFDLFYTSKKPEEGTGLGLWMTYELVKRNKGDISAESHIGCGTTFTIILPEASF